MSIFSRFLPKRKPVEIKNNIPKEKVRQIAEKYIEEIKNNGKRDFRF